MSAGIEYNEEELQSQPQGLVNPGVQQLQQNNGLAQVPQAPMAMSDDYVAPDSYDPLSGPSAWDGMNMSETLVEPLHQIKMEQLNKIAAIKNRAIKGSAKHNQEQQTKEMEEEKARRKLAQQEREYGTGFVDGLKRVPSGLFNNALLGTANFVSDIATWGVDKYNQGQAQDRQDDRVAQGLMDDPTIYGDGTPQYDEQYREEKVGLDRIDTIVDKGQEYLAQGFDDLIGLDRTVGDMRMANVGEQWDKGNYIQAAIGAFSAAPAALGDSMAYMIELSVAAPKMIGVSAAKKIAKETAKRQGLGLLATRNMINQAARVTKANRTALEKAKYLVPDNAGLLNMAAKNTQEQEQWAKENGVETGGWYTPVRFLSNVLNLGLERLTFWNIAKPGKAKAVKAIWGKLQQEERSKLVAGVAKSMGMMTKNYGKEAAQEYAQTWGEIINKQWDATSNTNLMNILNDPNNNTETIAAALIGGATGTVMGAPSTVGSSIGAYRQAGQHKNAYNNPKENLDSGFSSVEEMNQQQGVLEENYNTSKQAFDDMEAMPQRVQDIVDNPKLDEEAKIEAIQELTKGKSHAADNDNLDGAINFGKKEHLDVIDSLMVKGATVQQKVDGKFDEEGKQEYEDVNPVDVIGEQELAEIAAMSGIAGRKRLKEVMEANNLSLNEETSLIQEEASTDLKNRKSGVLGRAAKGVSYNKAQHQVNRAAHITKSTLDHAKSKKAPISAGTQSVNVGSDKSTKTGIALWRRLTGKRVNSEAKTELSRYDNETLTALVKEGDRASKERSRLSKERPKGKESFTDKMNRMSNSHKKSQAEKLSSIAKDIIQERVKRDKQYNPNKVRDSAEVDTSGKGLFKEMWESGPIKGFSKWELAKSKKEKKAKYDSLNEEQLAHVERSKSVLDAYMEGDVSLTDENMERISTQLQEQLNQANSVGLISNKYRDEIKDKLKEDMATIIEERSKTKSKSQENDEDTDTDKSKDEDESADNSSEEKANTTEEEEVTKPEVDEEVIKKIADIKTEHMEGTRILNPKSVENLSNQLAKNLVPEDKEYKHSKTVPDTVVEEEIVEEEETEVEEAVEEEVEVVKGNSIITNKQKEVLSLQSKLETLEAEQEKVHELQGEAVTKLNNLNMTEIKKSTYEQKAPVNEPALTEFKMYKAIYNKDIESLNKVVNDIDKMNRLVREATNKVAERNGLDISGAVNDAKKAITYLKKETKNEDIKIKDYQAFLKKQEELDASYATATSKLKKEKDELRKKINPLNTLLDTIPKEIRSIKRKLRTVERELNHLKDDAEGEVEVEVEKNTIIAKKQAKPRVKTKPKVKTKTSTPTKSQESNQKKDWFYDTYKDNIDKKIKELRTADKKALATEYVKKHADSHNNKVVFTEQNDIDKLIKEVNLLVETGDISEAEARVRIQLRTGKKKEEVEKLVTSKIDSGIHISLSGLTEKLKSVTSDSIEVIEANMTEIELEAYTKLKGLFKNDNKNKKDTLRSLIGKDYDKLDIKIRDWFTSGKDSLLEVDKDSIKQMYASTTSYAKKLGKNLKKEKREAFEKEAITKYIAFSLKDFKQKALTPQEKKVLGLLASYTVGTGRFFGVDSVYAWSEEQLKEWNILDKNGKVLPVDGGKVYKNMKAVPGAMWNGLTTLLTDAKARGDMYQEVGNKIGTALKEDSKAPTATGAMNRVATSAVGEVTKLAKATARSMQGFKEAMIKEVDLKNELGLNELIYGVAGNMFNKLVSNTEEDVDVATAQTEIANLEAGNKVIKATDEDLKASGIEIEKKDC